MFAPHAVGERRLVIVDRPGSVQSELRVGHLGIDRYDPRYFAAIVMSTVVGGTYWSRLNRRLREELGYTYGARCGFDPRRSAGLFIAATAVQTEVTAPAIGELVALLETARAGAVRGCRAEGRARLPGRRLSRCASSRPAGSRRRSSRWRSMASPTTSGSPTATISRRSAGRGARRRGRADPARRSSSSWRSGMRRRSGRTSKPSASGRSRSCQPWPDPRSGARRSQLRRRDGCSLTSPRQADACSRDAARGSARSRRRSRASG